MVKNILIADDEPNQIATIKSLLTARGYNVLTAADGVEAIEKAVNNQPDLIILDIMMPKMEGTEVAMILKNDVRTRHIPIFFVTAMISPEDQIHVLGSPNLILAKPVKLDELLEAIQHAA